MLEKNRTYKNSASSERVSISKVTPPCRMINGEIVTAKRNTHGEWVWPQK